MAHLVSGLLFGGSAVLAVPGSVSTGAFSYHLTVLLVGGVFTTTFSRVYHPVSFAPLVTFRSSLVTGTLLSGVTSFRAVVLLGVLPVISLSFGCRLRVLSIVSRCLAVTCHH